MENSTLFESQLDQEQSLKQQEKIDKPLQGVLVVSLEQAVAAPLCSCRLADAGARVIKIERDVGDFARGYDSAVNGESSYFVWINRGKESVALDIKSDEGKVLLHALLKDADVFIQNLAPKAAQRAGFGSEELAQLYPKLITCDISGYGEHPAYQSMKAYDLLIQSESGLVSVSGSPESYGRIGVSLVDISAGMNALVAIQQALIYQQRTGKGTNVKVSLFDCAVDWMSVPILQQKYTGKGPKRAGLRHPSIAPYGGFQTADDSVIVISIQNEREWAGFCRDILGDSALAQDSRFNSNNNRVTHRTQLEKIISDVFKQFSADTMAEKLQQASIAFGRINQTEDLIDHPLVRYTQVGSPVGDIDIIASPTIFDNQPCAFGAVPSIGQHTEQIKSEFLSR